MEDKDKLIEDQQAEIEHLEALVARYRADRRKWKERTFFDRYAAGPKDVVDGWSNINGRG
jgi:hypothetical protein